MTNVLNNWSVSLLFPESIFSALWYHLMPSLKSQTPSMRNREYSDANLPLFGYLSMTSAQPASAFCLIAVSFLWKSGLMSECGKAAFAQNLQFSAITESVSALTFERSALASFDAELCLKTWTLWSWYFMMLSRIVGLIILFICDMSACIMSCSLGKNETNHVC